MSEASPSPDGRWIVFTVVSLGLLMSSLDQTIVATALHNLQQELHTSLTWASWTLTVYALGRMVLLPLAGRLSDEYGRRRVFLASALVFTTASLCCGLATNIYLLIVLRAIQAIGGAGFTPSATGLVVDSFGSARDRVVGLFGAIFPIGAMLGPLLGGVLVAFWSWRGIFLVNVPIGVMLIVLGLRFLPPDVPRHQGEPWRMDVAGMVLLVAGVVGAMTALSYLGGKHTSMWSPEFVGPAIVGVVATAAFLRHVSRSSHPLVPPRFIHGPVFGAVNAINLLYGGAVTGFVALIPLYATTRYGIGVLGSGTLLTAQGVSVIALSALAVFALRRTGHRLPLYSGSLVTALGMVALAVPPVGVPAYVWLAGGACLIGAGTGWASPASRNAGLQLAPEHAASLAALRTMSRQVGSIGSVSVATAIIAQADDPGRTHAFIYAAFGLLLLAAIPIIRRIPDHRGAW